MGIFLKKQKTKTKQQQRQRQQEQKNSLHQVPYESFELTFALVFAGTCERPKMTYIISILFKCRTASSATQVIWLWSNCLQHKRKHGFRDPGQIVRRKTQKKQMHKTMEKKKARHNLLFGKSSSLALR